MVCGTSCCEEGFASVLLDCKFLGHDKECGSSSTPRTESFHSPYSLTSFVLGEGSVCGLGQRLGRKRFHEQFMDAERLCFGRIHRTAKAGGQNNGKVRT